MLWGAYIAFASQEVWYIFAVYEVHEATRALVVIASVDHELHARILVNKGTDERPQDWEHAWGPHNQQTTHRLRVVGLHYLNDTE